MRRISSCRQGSRAHPVNSALAPPTPIPSHGIATVLRQPPAGHLPFSPRQMMSRQHELLGTDAPVIARPLSLPLPHRGCSAHESFSKEASSLATLAAFWRLSETATKSALSGRGRGRGSKPLASCYQDLTAVWCSHPLDHWCPLRSFGDSLGASAHGRNIEEKLYVKLTS